MTQAKTVAVIQSNYFPWKGYFDIIHDVDVFVFYDDVQYTKNDWRNRNKIKTDKGAAWITVPVGKRIDRLIYEVEIIDRTWMQNHLNILNQRYGSAPYYGYCRDFLADIYLNRVWDNLSSFNQYSIQRISKELLGIQALFEDSRTYQLIGAKSERLVNLLTKVGATRYISGPTAKDYIDYNLFNEAGIELVFKDYSDYPEYPQLYSPFEHYVSILDLLFMTGPNAADYIWGWRKKSFDK